MKCPQASESLSQVGGAKLAILAGSTLSIQGTFNALFKEDAPPKICVNATAIGGESIPPMDMSSILGGQRMSIPTNFTSSSDPTPEQTFSAQVIRAEEPSVVAEKASPVTETYTVTVTEAPRATPLPAVAVQTLPAQTAVSVQTLPLFIQQQQQQPQFTQQQQQVAYHQIPTFINSREQIQAGLFAYRPTITLSEAVKNFQDSVIPDSIRSWALMHPDNVARILNGDMPHFDALTAERLSTLTKWMEEEVQSRMGMEQTPVEGSKNDKKVEDRAPVSASNVLAQLAETIKSM